MKKPLLATLGLAGACAACCAVPLLVPILSGLSVAGLVGLDWDRIAASREYMAVVIGAAVALAVALGLWLARRRRATSVCATAATPDQGQSLPASSCGCGGPAKYPASGRAL